jgi:hypothetical protein
MCIQLEISARRLVLDIFSISLRRLSTHAARDVLKWMPETEY